VRDAEILFTGRTVDEKGRPISGASLALIQGNNPLFPHLPAQTKLEMEGTSDQEGHFELVDVKGGQDLTLVATHRNFAETTFGPLRIRSGTRVELPDIVMGSGTLLKGLVTDVYDHPIAGALIQVHDPVKMAFQIEKEREPWKQMLTDAAGTYCFENVSFKSFEVTASAEGFATQKISGNVQFESVREKTISFQLTEGTFVAGYVVDEQGRSIESARVEAILVRNQNFSSTGTMLSEGNGFFSVEGLAKGTYTLRCIQRGIYRRGYSGHSVRHQRPCSCAEKAWWRVRFRSRLENQTTDYRISDSCIKAAYRSKIRSATPDSNHKEVRSRRRIVYHQRLGSRRLWIRGHCR